jgi:hypothetical protein
MKMGKALGRLTTYDSIYTDDLAENDTDQIFGSNPWCANTASEN